MREIMSQVNDHQKHRDCKAIIYHGVGIQGRPVCWSIQDRGRRKTLRERGYVQQKRINADMDIIVAVIVQVRVFCRLIYKGA